MKKETAEKLAQSLTAETTDLIPFLPYLFQDFWELGIEPEVVIELIERHVNLSADSKILDLACGKGAVAVKLARKLGIKVKGLDLIPEFISYAQKKAQELKVADLCRFEVEDINEAVEREKGYDCVIFGAIGNVLGQAAETLNKLKKTVKPGGYLLLDNYDFLPEREWEALFKECALELIETVFDHNRVRSEGNDSFRLICDSDAGLAALGRRVNELIEKHPDKKDILQGFIKSQQNEYDYLESRNSPDNVTWILKKL